MKKLKVLLDFNRLGIAAKLVFYRKIYWKKWPTIPIFLPLLSL